MTHQQNKKIAELIKEGYNREGRKIFKNSNVWYFFDNGETWRNDCKSGEVWQVFDFDIIKKTNIFEDKLSASHLDKTSKILILLILLCISSILIIQLFFKWLLQ